MKDHGNMADPALPPADRAVKYALDRMQRDPGLRHLLLHTQLWELLCEAEAARLGEDPEQVRERRAIDLADPDDRRDWDARRRLGEAAPALLEAGQVLLPHLYPEEARPRLITYRNACAALRHAVEEAETKL